MASRARSSLRRWLAVACLIGLGLAATACTPDVTVAKLRATFQSTFAHLVVVQDQELARPYRPVGQFYVYVYCHKGPRHSVQTGAGDNWLCVVHWQKYNGLVETAEYDVNVQTDGCFDAIGPGSIVGSPMLPAPNGKLIVNPLTQFDACFQA